MSGLAPMPTHILWLHRKAWQVGDIRARKILEFLRSDRSQPVDPLSRAWLRRERLRWPSKNGFAHTCLQEVDHPVT
jgi:hypothetical protein